MRIRHPAALAATGAAALLAAAPAGEADAQLLGGARDRPELMHFSDCGHCPEMVVLPPGSFEMGAAPGDPLTDTVELPRHAVEIGYRFAIAAHEVTFAQWDVCVAYGGCSFSGDDLGLGRGDMPVVGISWNDAVEYVIWLAEHTGQPYRLPSEAEWEYAARAGAEGPHYWTGGGERGCAYANLADLAAQEVNTDWDVVQCDDGFAGNSPVGSFRPNDFGLYDVLGNTWEFVEDCWNDTYDGAPADGNAWLAGTCAQRVVRGGASNSVPVDTRLSSRAGANVGERTTFDGFRVAVSLPNN